MSRIRKRKRAKKRAKKLRKQKRKTEKRAQKTEKQILTLDKAGDTETDEEVVYALEDSEEVLENKEEMGKDREIESETANKAD